jgi:hypothetical protein
MGQLSGIAFTTLTNPACRAACAVHACVPMKGTSRGRSAKDAVMSSATFWSDALYVSLRKPSELSGSHTSLLNSAIFWLRRDAIEYMSF